MLKYRDILLHVGLHIYVYKIIDPMMIYMNSCELDFSRWYGVLYAFALMCICVNESESGGVFKHVLQMFLHVKGDKS